MTIPLGVFTPKRAYFSIFPLTRSKVTKMDYLWLIEVAQSITKGNGSSVGIPKVNGLVPIQGSTPNVGAIDGRAFVPVNPKGKKIYEKIKEEINHTNAASLSGHGGVIPSDAVLKYCQRGGKDEVT